MVPSLKTGQLGHRAFFSSPSQSTQNSSFKMADVLKLFEEYLKKVLYSKKYYASVTNKSALMYCTYCGVCILRRSAESASKYA